MIYSEETFKVVSWHELDRVVKEFLGAKTEDDVSCVACHEWSNDSFYLLRLEKEEPYRIISDYDSNALNKALTEKRILSGWQHRLVVQQMVNNDTIPEGDYLVKVSW